MEEHASALHPASLPSSAHHVSRLVLSTLQPLLKTAPTRPCYRLIGGTLVQRTVTDVFPALETNYSGIKEVLDSLVKTYRGKEEEFGGFQREYGIQVGCPPSSATIEADGIGQMPGRT